MCGIQIAKITVSAFFATRWTKGTMERRRGRVQGMTNPSNGSPKCCREAECNLAGEWDCGTGL